MRVHGHKYFKIQGRFKYRMFSTIEDQSKQKNQQPYCYYVSNILRYIKHNIMYGILQQQSKCLQIEQYFLCLHASVLDGKQQYVYFSCILCNLKVTSRSALHCIILLFFIDRAKGFDDTTNNATSTTKLTLYTTIKI